MKHEKNVKKETAESLKQAKPADSGTGPAKQPKLPNPKWILEGLVSILLLAIAIATITAHLSPRISSSTSGPIGKITTPLNNSTHSRLISISGYTKNLPLDRPYVILAVDVKNIGLCWPKKLIIQPNTQFQTQFYESGPAGTCRVSLYAVNRDMYEKINQWFDEQRLSGMPLFPNRYRLDSVDLTVM